jgi:tetratricopeptide (TPR) repeat protein
MQFMQRNMMRWLKTRTCAGFAIVVIALPVLAGCSANGKIKPATIAQEFDGVKGLTIERLNDGREGFIIKESPQMDEVSLRDFDHAVGLLEDGKYVQAVDLLEKVIEKSPGVTAPYINMAIACRQIGELERAEEYLKTAVSLVPEHPAACNEYGLLYRKTGRFAEARAIYEKVIGRFPDYYPVHRNLGILCDLYLDDPVCALEHYEIYSRALPDDKQVKLWIADLQIRLGRN